MGGGVGGVQVRVLCGQLRGPHEGTPPSFLPLSVSTEPLSVSKPSPKLYSLPFTIPPSSPLAPQHTSSILVHPPQLFELSPDGIIGDSALAAGLTQYPTGGRALLALPLVSESAMDIFAGNEVLIRPSPHPPPSRGTKRRELTPGSLCGIRFFACRGPQIFYL